MTESTEKRAPVQGYPGGIPWAIHLEAYEVFCERYGQKPALIEGDCSGGFSTLELDYFVPGWRDRVSEYDRLETEVAALKARLSSLALEVAYAERHGWPRESQLRLMGMVDAIHAT